MFPSTNPPAMSFQRAPAPTQKKAAALWTSCIYVLPQHLSHSLWMHSFHTAPFLISLLEAQLPAWTSAGGWTHSPFMGKLQTGFLHFQNASNQFVISLPLQFCFFFGQWMVHTILSNNKQRRMTTAAWGGSSGYDSSSPDAWKMSLKFSLP